MSIRTRNDIDGVVRGYLHSCSSTAAYLLSLPNGVPGGMGWNNRMGRDGMSGDDAAKSRRPDLACMCRLISIYHDCYCT